MDMKQGSNSNIYRWLSFSKEKGREKRKKEKEKRIPLSRDRQKEKRNKKNKKETNSLLIWKPGKTFFVLFGLSAKCGMNERRPRNLETGHGPLFLPSLWKWENGRGRDSPPCLYTPVVSRVTRPQMRNKNVCYLRMFGDSRDSSRWAWDRRGRSSTGCRVGLRWWRFAASSGRRSWRPVRCSTGRPLCSCP